MKKPATTRLALHRDTVKILASELSIEQLRAVEGGRRDTGDSGSGGTSVLSTGPTYECPSHVTCTVG
jgi:hypothetical protein